MATATAAHPYNPYETAQRQFDHVADLLDLDKPTRDLLWP